MPNRERVVITLDNPVPWSVTRVGKQALDLNLGKTPQTIEGNANGADNQNIFHSLSASPNGLYLFTNTSEFGYMATRQGDKQIRIDFFNDPFGARWQNSGGEEPVPPQTSASPTAATNTPNANATQATPPAPPATGANEGLSIADIPRTNPENAAPQGPRTQVEALIQAQQNMSPGNNSTQTQQPNQNAGQVTGQVTGRPNAINNNATNQNLPQNQNQTSGQTSGQTYDQARPPAVAPGAYLALPALPQAEDPNQADVPFESPLVDSLRDIPTQPLNNLPANTSQANGGQISGQVPGQVTGQISGQPAPQAQTSASGGQTPAQQPAAMRQQISQPAAQVNGQVNGQVNNQAGGQMAQAPGGSGSSVFRSTINTGGPENWTEGQSGPKTNLAQTAPAGQQATPPSADLGAVSGAVQPPPASSGSTAPENQNAGQTNTTPQQVDQSQTILKPNAQGIYPVTGEEVTAPSYPQQAPQAPQDTQAAPGSPVFDQPGLEKVVQVPAPSQEQASGNATAAPVQYDENGKPIEPPPSPDELLRQAAMNINGEAWDDALKILAELKARKDLTQDQMEETLYYISDALFGKGSKDFAAYGDSILGASEEALNSNLKSERVPSMMLRLGYVNLKMDNVQEAEAYFNLLKRNYPNDENIPLTYYYWGDYFFEKERYQQAADQFQYIVQNYPDSSFVREASIGLARSLYNLGYYDQSFQIVDYIEKRWPRFYMEYPPILSMIGSAALNMGKKDEARERYWLYYNLLPSGPEAAATLVKIGDIYLSENKNEAAREVYQEAVRRFPNEDAGLVAMMRLAEGGANDTPSIGDMFTVFDRPYNEQPLQTYNKIIKEHPNSELAPLAQLKLAMWYLWEKRYNDALREATNFAAKYPNHELLAKAKEVAMNAYNMLSADSVRDQEYDRILSTWDNFPIVREQAESLEGESRLALAFSEWKSNRSSNALETLAPFFYGDKDVKNGEPALNLALTILVDTDQWEELGKLYNKVEMWELTPDTQRQLDYAMALASENMGKDDQAAALWESLRQRADLPPDQKSYMFYFLSRAAFRKKDMETAYYLGRDSLQGLLELAENDPIKSDPIKVKDLLSMLISITEGAGRINEALDWQQQYSQYVKQDDPDYPAMRYRLAQLYRKSGDLSRWAVTMQELVDKDPNSLYGRMAASELRATTLNDEVNTFLPPGGGF